MKLCGLAMASNGSTWTDGDKPQKKNNKTLIKLQIILPIGGHRQITNKNITRLVTIVNEKKYTDTSNKQKKKFNDSI